nr:hypothetical protein NCPCFENI_00522 [Cupriavidus sp.]
MATAIGHGDAQPLVCDRPNMGLAPNERHGIARLGKQPTKETAHGTCSHHGDIRLGVTPMEMRRRICHGLPLKHLPRFSLQ